MKSFGGKIISWEIKVGLVNLLVALVLFNTSPLLSNAFSASSQTAANNNLFSQNKSPFGNSSHYVFNPSSNPFSSPSPFSSASTSTFSNTYSAPSLFSSSTPQQSSSPFGLTFNNPQTSLSASTPTFGQTGILFGQSTLAFGSSNIFGGTLASSTRGSFFSSTSSLISSTNAGAFSQPTPSFGQTTPSAPFNFANMGQTQTAFPSGFSSSPGFGQFNSCLPVSSAQGSMGVQQEPITNPFGTLPAMPQLSIGQAGTIFMLTSERVGNKPAPVRISSLLTSGIYLKRYDGQREKYHPGPKVSFFTDEEEMPSTLKADALFVPKENPRALIIRPTDHQWLPSTENAAQDGIMKGESHNSRHDEKSDSIHEEKSAPELSFKALSSHRTG